ncbi:hypothetical protein DCC77_03350 [Candidatus Uhrbacteria bacterium]|nr:MAG: hypothetical protein DCC77_03350 [Candidatus Uhrbacteria bacterium]
MKDTSLGLNASACTDSPEKKVFASRQGSLVTPVALLGKEELKRWMLIRIFVLYVCIRNKKTGSLLSFRR